MSKKKQRENNKRKNNWSDFFTLEISFRPSVTAVYSHFGMI